MAEQPMSAAVINDWPGRISAVSPHEIGTGAQDQENLTSTVPGQVKCRKGMRPANFENTIGDGGENIISIWRYRRPGENWVIYLDTDGQVIAGKGPS